MKPGRFALLVLLAIVTPAVGFRAGCSAVRQRRSPLGGWLSPVASAVPGHCAGVEFRCRRPRAVRRGRSLKCALQQQRRSSSNDWYENIRNLPKSRLLARTKNHLLVNTAWALAISMVHAFTPQHIIDDYHVSTAPHSIMAGALGLLLVFRTNAAYDKFWEARKVWGSVTNTVRNIARLGMASLGADSPDYQVLHQYIKAFPFLLKQHLQNERGDEELQFLDLPEGAFLAMQEDPNPPLHACQRMTEIIFQAYDLCGRDDATSVWYRIELEHAVSLLIDCLGMCERILTTPVPRSYSRHTSRFLTMYCLTLPLVLVPHTEFFTVPIVTAVCWGLFSIEEIAYFIEQPFDPTTNQLDLKGFSEKMRKDADRMLAQSTFITNKGSVAATATAESQAGGQGGGGGGGDDAAAAADGADRLAAGDGGEESGLEGGGADQQPVPRRAGAYTSAFPQW